MPKGGQIALNDIFAEEARKSDNIIKNHNIRKSHVINLMLDNAENAGKRLVSLALGQNDFKNAPASVQRLAMIDVLTLAGINSEQAERQANPIIFFFKLN